MPTGEANGHHDTEPCPYCGKHMYADSERCPHCGNYISEEDVPRARPWWIIAGVIACLLIFLMWVVRG